MAKSYSSLWLEEYQYFPRIVKIMEESGDDLEKRAELADQVRGIDLAAYLDA